MEELKYEEQQVNAQSSEPQTAEADNNVNQLLMTMWDDLADDAAEQENDDETNNMNLNISYEDDGDDESDEAAVVPIAAAAGDDEDDKDDDEPQDNVNNVEDEDEQEVDPMRECQVQFQPPEVIALLRRYARDWDVDAAAPTDIVPWEALSDAIYGMHHGDDDVERELNSDDYERIHDRVTEEVYGPQNNDDYDDEDI